MAASPELKLKRFLHYGRESPFYQPGDRILNKYFDSSAITSVEALIAEGKETDAVVHIVKAFSDGYSAHPESLVFALAYCARQKESEALRVSAYNAVKTVCKSPPYFFLFIKFSTDLSAPASGWGNGFRRIVNEWYINQTPLELADCVTRYKGRYFWNHRDIIKLSHLKTDDVARKAVLKYVIRGLKEARAEFNSVPEAQAVLNYIQTVEDFKHCKEEERLARLLEQNKFTLDHLPGTSLRSKEIWAAVVPSLPLAVLLKNLRRLSRMKFLRTNHPVMTRVMEAMTNQAAISESSLHPALVLIALKSYEQSGRVKYVDPARTLRPPPQPNAKVLEALNQLLDSTFKLLVPTGLRYLVIIDTRATLLTGRCWQCQSVHPLHAAALMALALVKAERDVTVLAFGVGTPAPLALTKDMTQQQAQDKLKEVPTTSVDLTSPFIWARANKKDVDVFLAITDTQVKGNRAKVQEELRKYRSEQNQPTAKLVTCALAQPKFSIAPEDDPYMLDIAGFDEQVPRVIEAFSRGAF